ncbi:RAP protein, putative [Babesia caballi]|uniref:RAP protein, putative n=1 Tax=Babesia caballi TaxID=5871 RepID=A0AAV4LYI5_BABCB|nr:RAP protein, putative [Babesia caballi]
MDLNRVAANLPQNLLAPEELKKATREQLMGVYAALGLEDVRNRLDRDYVQQLLERTVFLGRALLPEDYARVFQRLCWKPEAASGFTAELNEGVRRLSCNFSHKQIAVILRAYASLGSRSLGTITELVKTFNKNVGDAEVWQLREVASALSTLRVPVTGHVESFYKSAVAHLPKHLKELHGDDIGIFLNAFSRQRVSHNEVLHFVDAHASRVIAEASHRNVALIANAFARAERHSQRLLQAVSERLHAEMKFIAERHGGTSSMEVVTPYIGANAVDSRVTSAPGVSGAVAANPRDTPEAQPTPDLQGPPVANNVTPLKIIDVAMIFNAFTKLEDDATKLLNAYIPWLNQHVDSEAPTLSLVLICHAYSRAGLSNRELFTRIAHVLVQRVNALNCQQLGLVAASFARAGQHVPLLFLRLADEVIYRGTVALKFKRYYFDFQSLEHLMQAFSRVGFRDQRVYCVLTTLLKRRLSTARPDEMSGDMIASMLTSMAPRKVDAFVPFITEAIVRTRDSTAYSTTALCRVLSALAKMKVSHAKIMDSLLKEVQDRVNEFQIPVLISTLKALAKLKRYSLALVRDVLKRCSLHLAHLTTLDIANLLSALSEFGFRNVSFLQKLAMCIKHRMNEFDRHQLYMIFTRLALLRTSDAELYKELLPRLLGHQHDFTEAQLADICVCYVYLLVHFDYLQRELHLQRVVRGAADHRRQQPPLEREDGQLKREPSSSTGHLASPAAGDWTHPALVPRVPYRMPDPATNVLPYGFKDHIVDAMLSHLGSKLDVATIFKVQTVHLYLKHIRPDIHSRMSSRALDVLRKCSAVKFALAEYMLTSSSVHREVSHFLNLMGVCHRNEVQFGPYLIDVVPETSLTPRVAIEYDGPTHFYAETTMRTAKSILKHEVTAFSTGHSAQILENSGWQVIHIPHQEWAQLVSAKQKIIYLDRVRCVYPRRKESADRKLYEGRAASTTTPLASRPPGAVQARHFSSGTHKKSRATSDALQLCNGGAATYSRSTSRY